MKRYAQLFLLLVFFAIPSAVHAQSRLLTAEENAWLDSRNDTIVVYPEKNNPPYSYQTAGGAIQGLSVDYIERIAKTIGANIEYLTPRSRTQVLEDAQQGKGDVLLGLSASDELEQQFLFTESFATVPVVIVARKDIESRVDMALGDFAGKRIVVVSRSGVEGFIRQNFPRIIVEGVSDDEVGLQKVVLGEVDAAAIDAASLSFLLSKQVLTSVKVVGNTGYDYHLSYAVPKSKSTLQTILEKGMAAISPTERQELIDRWITVPREQDSAAQTLFQELQTNSGVVILYTLFGLSVIGIVLLVFRRHASAGLSDHGEKTKLNELQSEVTQLEHANKILVEEIEAVRALEESIEKKLDTVQAPPSGTAVTAAESSLPAEPTSQEPKH